jgi:hypothetical protein
MIDLHGVWKPELESQNIDLFHNNEGAKYLVVQFF